MIPLTMDTIQTIRMILIGSLNKIIPSNTVPIVPIPVQIAYAVPIGKTMIKNKNLQSFLLNKIKKA